MAKIKLGPCEITGIFGPMASGKTYLISQLSKDEPRMVRFDLTGECMDDPTMEHVWDASSLYAKLRETPYCFRIAYHPKRAISDEFKMVLKVMWRLPVYKLLICDELHEICPVAGIDPEVSTMLRYARHDHLAFIGASQRIADVHKIFTAGSRTTILFHSQERRDELAIQDRWGTNVSNAMQKLRPLIFDDVSREVVQIPQCIVCKRSGEQFLYDLKTEKKINLNKEAQLQRELQQEEEITSEEDVSNADATALSSPGENAGENNNQE